MIFYLFHQCEIPLDWPRGSTPRTGDASRPRPTSDGGTPRNPVADSFGAPVIPLNVASKGDKDEQKWTPEIKPRVREMMVAIALRTFF